ncbi:hypothetical protein A3A40_00155 [Candidatus Kaiserbacteria bacterium RIFCSPLOWO2_01_FULL_54_20]|uniref:Uncharacterized protein n=1 Tax=Candidatus Kaiserbacteria bacterium RIFCSPLOWO2_01_FULL_54_20 TaxID=1798513 RepID=A0A1F6EJL7_9BACT|nr:MAG: hypothetical protein A3A40_00155 [Candidatus Kaiserbacteria bacterium RIFCSPLOWO2_01_FULL_54_20]
MTDDGKDLFLERQDAERSLADLLADLGHKKVRFAGLDEGLSIKGTDTEFSTVIARAPGRTLRLSVDPDGETVYAGARDANSTFTPVECFLRDDERYTLRSVSERGGFLVVTVHPSDNAKNLATYTVEMFRRLHPRRVRE